MRVRFDSQQQILEANWGIGMLSAFMAFIEQGDEVIIFEPFFDQSVFTCPLLSRSFLILIRMCLYRYISNIEMPGGTIRCVPLHPPTDGAVRTSSAAEWTIDFEQLERTINSKTKMIVSSVNFELIEYEYQWLILVLISRFSTRRKNRHRAQTRSTNALTNSYIRRHNPVGKVMTREELERIGQLAVKHNLIILSDEVYDRLYYVPFTRIATLSPELYERTLTVGSAGKAFYATGWRVGYLIGPPHLIKYVAAAHTRICYSSVSPLQEASAVAFEKADAEGFWEESRNEMQGKLRRFCEVFDELQIPVRQLLHTPYSATWAL